MGCSGHAGFSIGFSIMLIHVYSGYFYSRYTSMDWYFSSFFPLDLKAIQFFSSEDWVDYLFFFLNICIVGYLFDWCLKIHRCCISAYQFRERTAWDLIGNLMKSCWCGGHCFLCLPKLQSHAPWKATVCPLPMKMLKLLGRYGYGIFFKKPWGSFKKYNEMAL